MNGTFLRRTAALILVGLLAAGSAQATATFLIVNMDGAGEGFNDPTPWTPTGGNPATTLGQARLNAFQHAADLWGQIVSSNVTIRVEAQMDPLTCNTTSAVLGHAGTTSVFRDFSGAPLSNTWYPQAMANALAGSDQDAGTPDISATFNSAINGDAGCLGGASWYYGYDASPPSGQVDFITVVMHELGHGLGFQTFVDLATGTRFLGRNDMYMVNLEQALAVPSAWTAMTDTQRMNSALSDPNLRWTGVNVSFMATQVPLTNGMNGERVRLHAPGTLQPGSSVAHWTTDVTPNEVMEPVLTGSTHDVSLAKFLMMDMGWPMDASVGVVWRELGASAVDGTVRLTWRCEADEPIAGFRVYRAADGKVGTVLVTGAQALDAAAHAFVDPTPPAGTALSYTVAAVRPDGSEILSPQLGVTTAKADLALQPVSPNPFNASTTVLFSLDRAASVRLRIYDAAGRLVRTLVDEVRPAGPHTVLWDGRDEGGRFAASGAYVCRLEAGPSMRMTRMTLLK